MAAKKCTKKHDACAKLLLCQSKPTAFLLFSLPWLSSLLKLSGEERTTGREGGRKNWLKETSYRRNNVAQRKLYTPLDHMKDVAN